jgi:hypothetical protein
LFPVLQQGQSKEEAMSHKQQATRQETAGKGQDTRAARNRVSWIAAWFLLAFIIASAFLPGAAGGPRAAAGASKVGGGAAASTSAPAAGKPAASMPAGEIKEDAPAQPPRHGTIKGKIRYAKGGAKAIKELTAVSRVTGKRYKPDSFDKEKGAFEFKDMPGDASYDICAATEDGRQIEGIDLDFVDESLLRLADARREELKMPPDRQHEFTGEDAAALAKFVADLHDFMEIRRPLYIEGHGRRATMLVELLRTREFYSSGDALVWRVELWYFQENYGAWERVPNQEVVLERQRIAPKEWKKIDREYYPELSAHVDRQGAAGAIEFVIPQTPDPSTGRPAGSEPELKSAPHVLGLDKAKDSSTTAPAERALEEP